MIEFHKMHGLGNDFIFMHTIDPNIYDLNKLAIKLCDRRLGIGADGIVLVLPSNIADIRMRIFNSDGSEPNMCGNAIRCFAKYVYENKVITKEKFTIETFACTIVPELDVINGKVKTVKVDMGEPLLESAAIPMLGSNPKVIDEQIKVNGLHFSITSMLMAVPHTMIFVENVGMVDVAGIGPQIEKYNAFPSGTNVNFVEVVNPNEIKVRTWERGAGATLACGTGCCASVVASILNNKTNREVIVHLPAGDLLIQWAENNHVYMTGPAETVFVGNFS
jgi:diaminopimelate epimerase